jgi:translation initiation factor IF-1
MMRFASAPALTLESVLEDEVQAVTGFDAEGHGLVTVEVDGQVVQVLATLRSEDRAAGVRVRAGDRLRVEEVDDRRNRCVVSPLT